MHMASHMHTAQHCTLIAQFVNDMINKSNWTNSVILAETHFAETRFAEMLTLTLTLNPNP